MFDPFLVNIPIFYPLKTSEKQRFSGVLRGIKLNHWPYMGLIKILRLFQKLRQISKVLLAGKEDVTPNNDLNS